MNNWRSSPYALAVDDAWPTPALAACGDLATARPLSDWQASMGAVLWWRSGSDELPYVGTPDDAEWPGRHTHWTPLPVPRFRG